MKESVQAVRVTTEAEDITKVYLGDDHLAIVDSNTWERLRLHRWNWRSVTIKGEYTYAAAWVCGKIIYLHRLIVGPGKGQQVDHVDRDTLNCRDSNLRIATPAQNRANTKCRRDNSSGLKGVTWLRTSRKWMASITHKGVKYYLGVFQDKRRAAVAHDRAALAIHGEFAGVNYRGRNTRPKMPAKGYKLGQGRQPRAATA